MGRAASKQRATLYKPYLNLGQVRQRLNLMSSRKIGSWVLRARLRAASSLPSAELGRVSPQETGWILLASPLTRFRYQLCIRQVELRAAEFVYHERTVSSVKGATSCQLALALLAITPSSISGLT